MLDLTARRGTTVDAVFDLKEKGVFKGAKRRLKFTNESEYALGYKIPKKSEFGNLSENVNKHQRKEITVQNYQS